jgi:KRAB domain-containing zinc finger protein
VCSKAFVKSGQLTSHMKTHTQIKEHICDICGMAFAWAANMRTHRRRHEKAGLTPYHLSDCAKSKTISDK